MPGKSKDEQIAEKKQELEKRLSDVNDKIGNAKKAPKKGKGSHTIISYLIVNVVFLLLMFQLILQMSLER